MKIDLENFVSEFNKEKFRAITSEMQNVWLVFRDYESPDLFRRALNVILILKH